MRQYAWYSPEFNAIVLQTFMEDCEIVFEWGQDDIYGIYKQCDGLDPILYSLWTPLGEL